MAEQQRKIRIEMIDKMPVQTGLWCDMKDLMEKVINRNRCRIIETSENPGKRQWQGKYSIADACKYFENPEFSVDMDNSTWALLSHYYWINRAR